MSAAIAIAGAWCALSALAAVAWARAHRHGAAACLRARAIEADQRMHTCAVEDAANVWWHAHGGGLPETWLLLDVEADR